MAKEHTKNARPSTEQKHEKAEATRKRGAGGEKGDKRRGKHFQRKRQRPKDGG